MSLDYYKIIDGKAALFSAEHRIEIGTAPKKKGDADTRVIVTLREAPAEDREAAGYKPIVRRDPLPDTRYGTHSGEVPVIDADGELRITFAYTRHPIERLQAIRLADLAAKRYEVEVGGMILPSGMVMSTDRDTQAKLAGAVTALASGLTGPIKWKAPTDWIDLTAEQVRGIALAVAGHVQAAYAAEANHSAAVMALTDPEAVIAYDIGTGWPANPPAATP